MGKKVVVITGANSGVGFTLARRLLLDAVAEKEKLTVCLACRNPSRAEEAQKKLQQSVRECALANGDEYLATLVSIDIVQLDTCNLRSVSQAAAELEKRYPAIDRLVLNAGILPMVLSKPCLHQIPYYLTHPSVEGVSYLYYQANPRLPNGLPAIFCTNTFGHHCLVELLKKHLTSQSRPCRIVWTSSRAAHKRFFMLDDLVHECGVDAYSASKIQCDAASIGWSERFGKDSNVSSYSTCPGLCLTGLTSLLMPQFIWNILMPLLYLMRLISVMFTISADSGSEAAYYLCRAEDDDSSLDYRCKYVSEGRIGRTAVGQRKIPISSEEAAQLHSSLHDLMVQHHVIETT